MKQLKTILFISVLFITCCLWASFLFAQEITEEDRREAMAEIEEEFKWLQEEAAVTFVITASRVKEDIRKSASSITVITAEEIRKMGARNIIDALRTVPGVSFRYRSDGHYKFDIRGITKNGGQDVLMMLNSHPINENYTGGATWTHDTMIVDNIKRIEVIRGPGSAMYGANAFSGVVNIITKDAVDIDGIELSAGGGKYETQQYNLMAGKLFGDFEIAFNANYMKTEGFEPFIEEDAQTRNDERVAALIPGYEPASLAPGFAQASREKYDVALNLSYKGFTLDSRYVDRERRPPANVLSSLNENTIDQFTDYYVNLKYENRIKENLTISGKAYRNYNEYESHIEAPKGMAALKPAPESPFGFAPVILEDGLIAEPAIKNTRMGGEVQVNYEILDNNMLVAGATYEKMEQFDVKYAANFMYTNTASVIIPFEDVVDLPEDKAHIEEAERDFQALFLQDIWDITENLRLNLGARYDDYSDFGDSFNPRAAVVWEYLEGFDVKAMYGRAFRAPTFQELYMQNNPSQTGNTDLDPETVDTYELSLGALVNRFSARITGFRSSIKDSITSIKSEEGIYIFENAEELRTEGFEFEMKYDFDRTAWAGFNYTYQDAEDVDTGERIHLRPRQKGSLMANVELCPYANLYAGYHFQHDFTRQSGDERDDPDDFGVMNMTLIVKDFLKYARGLELRGSVYNVLDEEYSYPTTKNTLPNDLPMPGRSYFVELRLSF